jgi:predicted Rossmann fold flavoprotein
MSLPKSGSDGLGYELARTLGHTTTPHIFPALVPLVVQDRSFVRSIPGVSAVANLRLCRGTGAKMIEVSGSLLCTHFGLSGPVVLDISRHYLYASSEDSGAQLIVNWLPGESTESMQRVLTSQARRTSMQLLLDRGLPRSLARALIVEAGLEPASVIGSLARDGRRRFIRTLVEQQIPVVGDRGFTHAEVTAGGVPLSQLRLETMESRLCPGLHLVGEICDVDGRIGGFNFQWAWASGYVAGVALGAAAAPPTAVPA